MRLPSALAAPFLSIALLWSQPCQAGNTTALRHALAPGQRLVYAQDYRTDSRTDARSLFEQGDGPSAEAFLVSHLLLHLQARMLVDVLAQDGQGWLLSVQWERIHGTITANDHPDALLLEALRKGLARPLILRMDREGRLGDLYVDPGSDPKVLAITRTLLSQMQCVLPASAGGSWAVEEADAAGRFEAFYKIEEGPRKDGVVRLRKWLARHLPAQRTARPGELQVARSLEVLGSRGLGFDNRGGHLRNLDAHEVQRTVLAGKTVGGSDVRFSLRLMGTGHLEAAPLLARNTWAKQQMAASRATGLFVEATWEEQETAVQSKALGESTVDEILASLQAAETLGEKEGGDIYLKLKALAFVHPETCVRMGEKLMTADPESLTMRLLASALSTTGTIPSQEALAAAIRSRREEWLAMAVLLPALGQSPDPSAASIGLMEELAYGSTLVPIASTAQLMLGSMAHNLSLQGQAERAAGIVDAALLRLEAARDPVLSARFLLCLGNAGSVRALPLLKSWALAPDPYLRGLAFYALRWIEAAEVDALLLKALEADPDVQVRFKVIDAFKYRRPSPALVTVLGRVLVLDDSPRVRLAALGNLWDLRAQFPQVMPAVEAARKDSDEDIRKLAETLLGK